MKGKLTHIGKRPHEIEAAFKRLFNNAPRAVGAMAVNLFKDNFSKEGFQDDEGDVQKWQERKNDPDPGRGILMKTGKLRDSIRVVRATSRVVTIGSRLAYAKIHNEGYRGGVSVRGFHRTRNGHREQVRPQTRRVKMPKRKFIGDSRLLTKRMDAWFQKEIRKCFK